MLQYAMSKKAYDTQFHLFRKHISDYVIKVQEDMGFYNLPKWSDVEADEAHGRDIMFPLCTHPRKQGNDCFFHSVIS